MNKIHTLSIFIGTLSIMRWGALGNKLVVIPAEYNLHSHKSGIICDEIVLERKSAPWSTHPHNKFIYSIRPIQIQKI